jgi:predicted alpha/beta-hydrolase family hydrolase
MIESHRFHLSVAPDRQVAACWLLPDAPRAALTLAHGAGTNLNHPFMHDLALALAHEQLAVLRFNFFFTERQSRRPDPPAQIFPVIQAAAGEAVKRFPGLPLFLAGRSFGGRMSSRWVATQKPERICGLIFFGFPLHPKGKPDTTRAEHLQGLALPLLFVQGERDALATPELLSAVVGQLRNGHLVYLPGANHGLEVGKKVDYQTLGARVRRFIDTQP